MNNDLGNDLNNNFFKIIPMTMLKKLAESQKLGKGNSMVIILTEGIIRDLKQGKATDIEMHNSPMDYIVFVPEKLIKDYYKKESKK